MILIINHYILQSETSNNLDVQLIESSFNAIVEVKDDKLKHEIQQVRNSSKSVDRMFNEHPDYRWLQEKGLYVIFQSQLLTCTIAQRFISSLDSTISRGEYARYIKIVFYKLIIPLLILKESSFSFAKVNSIALLDMFQAFANASEKLSLHERSLQSLFKCIRESLDPDNLSEKSFYVSIQSLIVLKNWNCQISYKESYLYLDHDDTEGFRKQLKLHYEEKILQLLRNTLNRPDNLKEESQTIARSILSSKKAHESRVQNDKSEMGPERIKSADRDKNNVQSIENRK